MKIYEYPSEAADRRLADISARSLEFKEETFNSVRQILQNVRERGDAALIEYAKQFDAPDLLAENIKATEKEFEAAQNAVSPAFIKALDRAVSQITEFHSQQKRKSWINTDRPGTFLGQMFNPVDRAGVYVPGAQGGETPLVSSVLMNVIPAKIAGVENVVMVTPSRKDGSLDPHLLVAAQKVGVDAVYKVGSAWAIAALAYGTETIDKCDVIVGPGNIYVTVAKKIVSGTVGIDMIAGPSEVLVIADQNANPAFVAADLLSQAEHDVMASAVLLTNSESLAKAVKIQLASQLKALNRKKIAEKSIEDYGAILVVSDLDKAIMLSNQIAPEHLELLVDAPFEYLGKIRNAGAVFLGEYTPEPVGDYIAGPNHVLPTAGTARFSSSLSVDNFIKKTSILNYSKAAFEKEAEDILCLAGVEGLDAHANSVKVRLKKE